MKKTITILFLAFIGYYLVATYFSIPFGGDRMNVAHQYLTGSKETLHVANAVTAIVVNFRGFDTLGEVTVLFLAATGLGSILFRKREHLHDLNIKRKAPRSSRLVTTSGKMLFPLIVLLGAYVFIHGHLTPGGGFQGGVIIATGYLLMLIAYRRFSVKHDSLTWVEALAGATFAGLGLTGLLIGKDFLENFLPAGILNSLLSGGIIGIIYIAVGFKVASELTGILDTMLSIKVDIDEEKTEKK